MAWYKDIQHFGRELEPHSGIQNVAQLLLPQLTWYAKELHIPKGVILAAIYDLLVSASYYQDSVANVGWMYCASIYPTAPLLTFPFMNACPVCTVKKGEIVKCTGNKPESGKIGKITSDALLLLLQEIFRFCGNALVVKTGQEPIDFIIADAEQNSYLVGEIKAAPLVVLPLAVKSEVWSESKPQGVVAISHKDKAAVNALDSTTLSIFLPVREEERWSFRLVELGTKSSGHWAYHGLVQILQQDATFMRDYLLFWANALNAYEMKDRMNPLYWLTNGCGSKGSINVSDSKTSVGMDRTDDIKKGIYQLLKIGAEAHTSSLSHTQKIALISNIHAIRHYEDYFQPIEDLIWGYNSMREKGFFNLYDGLFSFTRKHIKDSWLSTIFSFTDDAHS